jgi:hypothetical protein
LIGDVAVVAEGGPAERDRAAEEFADDGDEGLDLVRFEAGDALEGMELRVPEGFVDVDVAEAGDVVLSEEPLLESAGAFFVDPVGQVLREECEGIGAEVGGFGSEGFVEGGVVPDAAEAAGVAEADGGAGVKFKDEVGVLGDGGGCGEAVNAAGHAEVEEERLEMSGAWRIGVGVGDEEEFFAVAMSGGDVVVEEVVEGSVFGGDEIRAEDADGGDGAPKDVGL